MSDSIDDEVKATLFQIIYSLNVIKFKNDELKLKRKLHFDNIDKIKKHDLFFILKGLLEKLFEIPDMTDDDYGILIYLRITGTIYFEDTDILREIDLKRHREFINFEEIINQDFQILLSKFFIKIRKDCNIILHDPSYILPEFKPTQYITYKTDDGKTYTIPTNNNVKIFL